MNLFEVSRATWWQIATKEQSKLQVYVASLTGDLGRQTQAIVGSDSRAELPSVANAIQLLTPAALNGSIPFARPRRYMRQP